MSPLHRSRSCPNATSSRPVFVPERAGQEQQPGLVCREQASLRARSEGARPPVHQRLRPGTQEDQRTFRADPRANGGSLFRIYRDVRFSKDKSPYKTHTGIHFRHEFAKDVHAPGFYLHLAPAKCSWAAAFGTRPARRSGPYARPSWMTRPPGSGSRTESGSGRPSSSEEIPSFVHPAGSTRTIP